jgi:membrane protease YdiL (CAAX protease family)
LKENGSNRSDKENDKENQMIAQPSKFPWLYLLLAYSLAWIFWIPVALTRQDYQESPLLLALMFLGVFGPGIAGIVMTYREQGKEGGRDFWRRVFDFRRISLKWYALIIFLYPILYIISIAINHWLGGDPPEFKFIKEAMGMPSSLLIVMILYLLQSALEELGWRGYMLDRLQAIWKPTVASLVLAVFHAFWHLPLFWVVGTNQSRWASVGGFAIFATFGLINTIYFTWCYNDNHRSTLAVILLHTVGNLSLDIFMLSGTGEHISKAVIGVGAVLIAIAWNLPSRKQHHVLST